MGHISAEGITKQDAEAKLRKELSEIIDPHPGVTVIILDLA